jgi:signal transduction histidine kinase
MSKLTSEIVHKNQEKILQLWQDRAYKEVVATLNQKSLVLKNSMLSFLEQIESALIDLEGDKIESKAKDGFGKIHGITRAGTVNYSIDQVIYEYQILRQVLFEVIEEEKSLEKNERDLLIGMIEEAVNLSATAFSDTLKTIRERFITTLTHDLKTPVTSAKLAAELLLKRTDDPQFTKKIASTIIKSMNRITGMIGDLLDASRLEAGETFDLHFETFDLSELINEVVLNSEEIYGKRFLFIKPQPIKGLWSKEGIRRVIENLINNATKYGFPESLINLSLEVKEKEIQFSIHNFGEPIPEEQQGIIFQQFRRVKRNNEQTGWGVGLLISKGIVEAHSGSISILSRKDEGTTFTIHLPIKKS